MSWFKVLERQWCACLERLDRNVAADLTHNWQIEQFADQEALVIAEIGHDDFEEVIGLTGDEVARNDLRHLDDGFLERQRALVGVPVYLDAYENREAEPDAVAPQGCPITFDVPVALQTLDATQTRRWRQADLVGQLDVGQTAIGLQLRNNAAVDRIKVIFWHNNAYLNYKRAYHCFFIADISVVSKDMSRDLVPR